MNELTLPRFPSPARLLEATRALNRTIRRLGLDADDDRAPENVDEAAEVAWVRALSDGARSLGPRDERRLRAALPFAASPNWQALPALREAVLAERLRVTERTLTQLLHWLPEDRGLLAAWVRRPRRAARDRWGLVQANRPLADQLADRVCAQRWTVDRALSELGVSIEAPLGRAVLARLTSPAATRWLAQHPMTSILAFVEARSREVWVGRVGAVLFGQLPGLGLQPGDVQEGTALGDFVGRFAAHLPPESDSNAVWRALGPGAEVIRWWRLQRDLDAFFNRWDAERQRSRYWRGKVRDIRNIHEYPNAQSLAILIGGHWFVEFGATGNAVYVYESSVYERLRMTFQRAHHPSGLKNKAACADVFSHTPRWEERFDSAIARHSRAHR